MLKSRMLVVDDEPNMEWLFKQTFSDICQVVPANSGEEALEVVKDGDFDLIMLDQRLPGMTGLETFRRLKASGFGGIVIMMTAYGEVKDAVDAMKSGAYDYVTKPFNLDELRLIVKGALEYRNLSKEVSRLKAEVQEKFQFKNIITVSTKMLELFTIVEKISSTDASVLIQGESGTGKELFAKAIHYSSQRKDGPFIPFNCAALPENLLESELFGYEEGAFSGARKRKLGRLELADGGTFFLDEVGDLPLSLQPKLLRVLEDKRVERLGGTASTEVDLRVLAATNRDLRKEVQEGRFRRDLYFRLAVIPITIPPLRERKEDIPVLLKYFLKEFSEKAKKPCPDLSRETISRLTSYGWPGNVRELKNLAQQISLLCDDAVITPRHLSAFLSGTEDSHLVFRKDSFNPSGVFSNSEDRTSQRPPSSLPPRDLPGLKDIRDETWTQIEKGQIREALILSKGNKSKAALKLGISRRTLQNKIKKYGL